MLVELAQSVASSRRSYLEDLDYSIVQQCMHCGLCLPNCPTYDATKLERNSPRGRIALMRSIADGELTATEEFADEMYFCLGCLACMTACPAGVNYAELFEQARAEAESAEVLTSLRRRFIRFITLKWLFMDHSRLQVLGLVMRLYQQLGFQWLVRNSGVMALMPERLRELEAMTPTIQPRFSDELIAPRTLPDESPARYRVALLTGCAQDLIFSDVNLDTLEVLKQNGCEVVTPPNQPCCGSLHAHNGEREAAKDLARRQIDLLPPESFDAIITNAAGCGSHLKHYASLLKEDPVYYERAEEWERKVKDIHEWLVAIEFRPPGDAANLSQRVTYHEACHLCHGQKITAQPREILKAIPGLELAELPESNWCCGSAGIYNIVQPEMANELLDRKLGHINAIGASTVATGNPGCLLHIQNGVRQQGKNLRLAHPVSLLAEAYRREASRANA
ncbi:MAG: Lactate utilization protein A [Verrucomicrobia subdivision 3 bacterium]|nr:Lactate utilization protein A [Limisphaerales bacterium]MCS1413377.1 Lactate utilization protein A [Limisphaerales bacterium]